MGRSAIPSWKIATGYKYHDKKICLYGKDLKNDFKKSIKHSDLYGRLDETCGGAGKRFFTHKKYSTMGGGGGGCRVGVIRATRGGKNHTNMFLMSTETKVIKEAVNAP